MLTYQVFEFYILCVGHSLKANIPTPICESYLGNDNLESLEEGKQELNVISSSDSNFLITMNDVKGNL